MKCFHCGKEINLGENEKYKMVPIESPYLNLFFHKETCYREIKSTEKEYLTENAEKIWEWASNNLKNKNMKRK